MPNRSRQKGDREERAIVNLHIEEGHQCYRTLESGKRPSGPTWDVTLQTQKAILHGECKHRANGFKEIYGWLKNDFLTIRADNKERLYVVPERVWKELIK